MVCVAFLLFAVQSVTGTPINHLTLQGSILVIVASGIGTCLLITTSTTLGFKKHFRSKPPTRAPVRHMNLLGLPDDVVQDIAVDNVTPGRMTRLYRSVFELDMCYHIRSSPKLMAMHSTAEVFDSFAETLFHKSQVGSAILPHCAWLMHCIQNTGCVFL